MLPYLFVMVRDLRELSSLMRELHASRLSYLILDDLCEKKNILQYSTIHK